VRQPERIPDSQWTDSEEIGRVVVSLAPGKAEVMRTREPDPGLG